MNLKGILAVSLLFPCTISASQKSLANGATQQEQSEEPSRTIIPASIEQDKATCELIKQFNCPQLRPSEYVICEQSRSLCNAIRHGDLAQVQQSIQNGANVDYHGNHLPPLHLAAIYGNDAIVRELINAGADIHGKNVIEEDTPLQLAASRGHSKVIQTLCAHDADTEVQDRNGATALHLAAMGTKGHIVTNTAIAALVQAGARLDAQYDDRGTPLHAVLGMIAPSSFEYNITQTAQALIRAGADIDAQDTKGRTPLNRAITKRTFGHMISTQSICMLFGRGALVPDISTFPSHERAHADKVIENHRHIAERWAWEVQQALLAYKPGTQAELPQELVNLIFEFTTDAKPKGPKGFLGWLAYYFGY